MREKKTVDELAEIARRLLCLAPRYGESLTPELERRLEDVVAPLSEEDRKRLWAVWVLMFTPEYPSALLRR
jgi:hypothetical protein